MIRLKDFAYFEPTSTNEAVEILASNGKGSFPLAGGTDLLVRMKRRDIAPATLVNLKRIKGLDEIVIENNNKTRIGALTTIAAIEDSSALKNSHPILVQSARLLGARPIRNIATLGGNIGRASPASDMAPALVVLQARVLIEGPSGNREINIEDIFKGPGTTSLLHGEIITAFKLNAISSKTGAAYLKLGRRAGGGDCALVGVAALISAGKEHPQAVRIAMASVGPKTLRARQAEQILMSGPLTEEQLNKAAQAASEEALPISDMRCSASYRKKMIRVLTFRALREAQQQAKGAK